jgi:hypothetical protein
MHKSKRDKAGKVIVSPVAFTFCFFSLLAIYIEFDDMRLQDILGWLEQLYSMGLGEFYNTGNHDVNLFMLLVAGITYGVVGFWWCYFYDRESLTDIGEGFRVYSTHRDLGFALVYCCLPMVITFVGLFVLFWVDDIFSKAWLDLVIDAKDFDGKVFGVSLLAFFSILFLFVTFLFLAFVVKGIHSIVQYRKFGSTVLTLNRPRYVGGDHVKARFRLNRRVIAINESFLQLSVQYSRPNSRSMRLDILYKETVNVEVIDDQGESIIEIEFYVPCNVVSDISQYKWNLFNNFRWIIGVELEVAQGVKQSCLVSRAWLIDVGGEWDLVG